MISRWHVDEKCHLEPIFGRKMIAKSVPKRSKISPETAFKGDSISKLKKEGAASVSEAAREHKLEGFGPSGGGKQGGGRCHHTPDDLVQGQGVGGLSYIYRIIF